MTTVERARLFVLLGGLTAFGPLSIDMYLPALPMIGRDLHASESIVQLTLTACLGGLALGQIVSGPLSDMLGRRRPLMVGVAAYAMASVACAFAPSAALLVAFRVLQGLSGAAGIVIARAVVRDMYTGAAAARYFSRLVLIMGLAPILAPVLGAQLLRFTTWNGIFFVLALISLLLLLGAALALPETLPLERRQASGFRNTVRAFGNLFRDPKFVGFALAGGLGFGAMFAYISGSPFVLQGIYHVSPQIFSLIFATNALGFVITSQVNGSLVSRIDPARLMLIGLIGNLAGGLALLAVVLYGHGLGVAAILPPLFLLVSSVGFIVPNAVALALTRHPEAAGTGSALLGLVQSGVGAIGAPLVGIEGTATAIPMAAVIAISGSGAVLAYLLQARR
ncbi:MAG TPA: Bcr/CflA family multidrug efflux MFS transporter [Candidatus Dormibacteraeota bacterium]|nr:Bcr/CflA family multidrug efflux MFS transporter [Candidatus Dormibacteraeota bacterium]